MDKYKFGELIYNQRKKLGLTQDELGRKLNVTNKAVSKWEVGETLPDIQLLEKLASTLNVTIDELLTQKKVEPEKVIVKPNKTPHIIHLVITCILFILTITFGIKLIPTQKEIDVTLDNAYNYFLITPIEKSESINMSLTIYGSILEKEEIIDPELTISFTIQYYYLNNDSEVSEIIYIDREVTYTGTTNDFSITVEPKYQISNFKAYYGFNVLHELKEVKGRVIE